MAWWWLLFACSGSDTDDSDEPAQRVTAVEVRQVGPGAVADRITTTAVVEAVRSADLIPVNPGVVKSVHADDGDSVTRGQLLAVLENVSLEGTAISSRAEVTRLTTQVTEARRLAEQGAMSQREVEDLQFQLDSARRSSSNASRAYGQSRLTAPFDGVVARRDVKVGELASGVAAFQIVDLSSLQVVIDLPERDFARVEAGQPAELVSAYDVEIRGRATVERVAPVIDSTTGTFRATLRMEPDQPLRPGQFVNVHLEVDRRDGVVVVPRKALVWEDGRALVYTVDPPGEDDGEADVARRKPIEIGLMDETNAQVVRGVESGAKVVIVGQSNLKDGAPVKAIASIIPEPPSE